MFTGPLKETVREIVSATVPHAKLIAELATDMNMYTGYPLKRGKRAEYGGLAIPAGEKLPKMLKRGLDVIGSRGMKQVVSTIAMPIGRVEAPITAVQKGRKTITQAITGYLSGIKGQRYVPVNELFYSLVNTKNTITDLQNELRREFKGGLTTETTRRANTYKTIEKLQEQFGKLSKLMPGDKKEQTEFYQEQ